MNELTKDVLEIGATKRLSAQFTDGGGVPSAPTTVTLLVEKDGAELVRLTAPATGLVVGESGYVYYDYVVTGEFGAGRYTYRLFGSGSVSDAEEDWFYVRRSAFANPGAED